MQIIIDVPDVVKQRLDEGHIENGSIMSWALLDMIKNGQVLPKGHGDLIDREVAKEVMMHEMCGTGYQGMAMRVLDSDFYIPTVIEADEENKE